MRVPYELWRHWVEAQKGPVTLALLQQPDVLEGLRPRGTLLSFRSYNDFGHFLSGDIRVYCPTGAPQPAPDSCRYLLRRAYVPLPAEDYGEINPVSEWVRANFDARELARNFRELGLAPDIDWGEADRAQVFSAAPSPGQVLADNAVVVRLHSIECPQMGAAIEALEGKALGMQIDFAGVGPDQKLRAPVPHAVSTTFTLFLLEEGGYTTIEGSRGPAAQIVDPILDAADACERARTGA